MSLVFNEYANYYDLIYNDKEYVNEVEYVLDLVRKHSDSPSRLLDIGCGTGKHAVLIAQNGFDVVGLDLSDQMIDIAKSRLNNDTQQKLSFLQGTVDTVELDGSFDVITSLFHVINYQDTVEKLNSFLAGVSKKLANEGLFIFDFWHGKGVENDAPTSRTKEFENDKLKVHRVSYPMHYPGKQLVEVTFKINIQNKATESNYELEEVHNMRYLYQQELQQLVESHGFSVLACNKWLTNDELTDNDWYGCIVAKKENS